MKKNAIVRTIAVIGMLAIILGAILPALSSFLS